MPELPEVETVRRCLLETLVGRRIEDVQVFEPRLRERVDPSRLSRAVRGRRVRDVERRAKYLLIELDSGDRLLVHLGMSGKLLLRSRRAPRESHVHVTFSLAGGDELRYQDPRRFGMVDAIATKDLGSDRRLCNLGIEPLSAQANGKYFYDESRGVRKPVKNLLMDANTVVGVGNIYANEALFLAGVHPRRAAGRLSLERWKRLAKCVKQVLRDAIRKGGTTLSDFADTSGEPGYFRIYLRVYGREGEPCRRCKTALRRIVMAGRSTYYCARCQR